MSRCAYVIGQGKNHGKRCVLPEGHSRPHTAVPPTQPTREQKRRSDTKRRLERSHPCANYAQCGRWCTEGATRCQTCSRELNGKRSGLLAADRAAGRL